MGRRSNKQLAEILLSSKEEDLELDRKITLATDEVLLHCDLILRDMNNNQ